jgi:hypothetical protein
MRIERRHVALVGVAGLVMSAMVYGVTLAQRRPEGPVEPIWDREACAHCRMHVGERAFAAQLQTEEGEVLFFDDPGCLLLHAERAAKAPRAMYFRHATEDRWILAAQVRFTHVKTTPMGFGLAATDGREGLSLEQARAHARARAEGAQ